ncbi:hypothetical protein [Longimicrobium sp.]|uniref:hypothetical protein n=1 Tax=Longimicrobium sp. TaxID=2029185 RepID=UPI002B781CAC|nr:hypothetical protein [Longimicrobium sp.]HSU14037.1 hypothetical protein [Longimicrobium sp.]
MLIRRILPAAALLLAGVLSSCGDGSPSGPTEKPGSELVFLRVAGNAPALQTDRIQFWAKVGDGIEREIRYANTEPGYNGDECLEFKIPGNGLWKKPDGSLFQRGDSVLISIRVVDLQHFSFEFQPAGLRFSPDHPAELRLSFRWADPDLNGDGVVDDRDRSFNFGIWKQEADGLPWVRIGTSRDSDLQELRADISGFTKYAMAGG